IVSPPCAWRRGAGMPPESDDIVSAQKASLPKRFYKMVAIEPDSAGFTVRLDGKKGRTPGKAPLGLPTRELAEAIAQEWREQGERIDPTTMPLTKLVNSAIEGVSGR